MTEEPDPIYLELPVDKTNFSSLKCGDIVYLSGIICTGRDQVHRRIIEWAEKGKKMPSEFQQVAGGAIYHMGPIVEKRDDGSYRIVSGGPTTSDRMSPYQEKVCNILDIRIVIGKGGMRGIQWEKIPAVYLQYPGGAGAIVSKFIEKVVAVIWLDFGPPEAAWILKVKNFGPLLVGSDMHGNTLFHST